MKSDAMGRLLFLAVLSIAGIFGCGGGTSGTSPTPISGEATVFRGIVRDDQGPIVGARVQLAESDIGVVSDSLGRYSFLAEVPEQGNRLEFLVQGESFSFAFETLFPRLSVVGTDARITGAQAQFSATELVLTAIGGGACAGAFDSGQIVTFDGLVAPLVIFNQVVSLPPGTDCTLFVSVRRNGSALAGVGFELVFVPLFKEDERSVIASGSTDSDGGGTVVFALGEEGRWPGYYVIEAPTDLPRENRVGVVINPLAIRDGDTAHPADEAARSSLATEEGER